MPALSSDSDKDGEDEGNDEDELSGLQSFHVQSNCNTERDSGNNGRGACEEVEKKCHEREVGKRQDAELGTIRYGQKEKVQNGNGWFSNTR